MVVLPIVYSCNLFLLENRKRFWRPRDDAVKIRDGRALHDSQVKQRLGIAGVSTNLYSWRSRSSGEADKRTAQIDMVIERGDNTINLCGMKFSEGEFAINKDYRFDSIQIDYP